MFFDMCVLKIVLTIFEVNKFLHLNRAIIAFFN